MSVKEMSLYSLGGDPIQYFGLDPINPRSSLPFFTLTCSTKIFKKSITDSVSVWWNIHRHRFSMPTKISQNNAT